MASANERALDQTVSHAVDLLRLDAEERRKVLALLRTLEGDLVAQLARIDPTAPVRSRYREERLQALLAQTRETIRASYREINTTLRSELLELADLESQWAVRSINRAAGMALADQVMTRGALRSLVADTLIEGAPSAEWWSRQAGDTMERFADAMRTGMAQGETIQQLMRRVRGGVQDGQPVQGFMEISRRNAAALVRSSVQSTANATRLATLRENADVIRAIVLVVTLDSRTSEICIARSGLEYTLEGEPIGHDVPFLGGPGYHWGCRTTIAPVMRSAAEIFGRSDLEDIPPSTRASLDGQTPETTTFDGFLRGKSETFQNNLLGPGKAELWREGRITLRDLIDQTGRPLTLEELRERI